MNINDINIINYVEQLTGEKIHLKTLDMSDLSGLALHLRKGYQLYQGELMNRALFFAIPFTDVAPSPGQAQKNIAAISAQVHKPVILVLEKLPSYLRIRYIEQRIPFMIPGQQLFAPMLLMDMRSQNENIIKKTSHFRPSTQSMIIYHLMVKPIDGMSQDQIAKRLGYSTMTISRAITECKDKGLITAGTGLIQFKYNRLELWKQSKIYLRSPIIKIRFIEEKEIIAPYLKSGMDALSHYTDIAGDNKKSVALSKDQYNKLSSKYGDKINVHHGTHAIEVWNYNPKSLTATKYVDRLSLYLSLDDDQLDERTSLALDSLINDLYD